MRSPLRRPPAPPGARTPQGAHALQGALAWLWAAAVMTVVVALDQLSKAAVRNSIVPGETRSVLPGVQLVNTRNQGVAFGFLSQSIRSAMHGTVGQGSKPTVSGG